MMKLDRTQIILSLIIGVALGSGFSWWKCKQCTSCYKDPAHYKEKILDRISTKLNLTEDQKTKVSAAIDKKHEKIKEIRGQARTEIKAALNEEQSKKFDELIAKCKGFN